VQNLPICILPDDDAILCRMKLSGIQKLTLLDYPGKTAATVFTPGCNFRCPFCQNSSLVENRILPGTAGMRSASVWPDYPLGDFFAFLEKRHGLLDGICITGGEPLLQPELANFCARIKEAGFAVKLDTNGSSPARLESLMNRSLIDYVALDVKNAPRRYGETIGRPGFDIAPVRASIDCLLGGSVPFELRTTVVRELHTPDDLEELARWIAGTPAWFLQGYQDSDTVIAGKGALHAYPLEDMQALLPRLRAYIPNACIRGV
jgi:pyruvate formate lyase activating enzyme